MFSSACGFSCAAPRRRGSSQVSLACRRSLFLSAARLWLSIQLWVATVQFPVFVLRTCTLSLLAHVSDKHVDAFLLGLLPRSRQCGRGSRGLAFPDCLSVDTNLERRHAGHPVTDGKLMGRGLTLSPSTEPHWGQPWLRSGVYAPVPVRS